MADLSKDPVIPNTGMCTHAWAIRAFGQWQKQRNGISASKCHINLPEVRKIPEPGKVNSFLAFPFHFQARQEERESLCCWLFASLAA